MKVAICIITLHRRDGLRRLLEGISSQTFQEIRPEVEVIVVDNDPLGSSKDVIDKIENDFTKIKYFIEDNKGIPYARNRSLREADTNADYIVFIDDDEVPEENWLEELLLAQKKYNADIVTGPVIPIFMEKPSDWILEGEFFSRRRYESGTSLKVAATNNTLVKKGIFDEINRAFDINYALTGGSDTHLFMDIYKRGYNIIWADNAIVKEWIPRSRANKNWLLKRGYREGNVYSRCEIDIYRKKKVKYLRLLKACIKLCKNILTFLLSIFQSKANRVKCLRNITISAGEIVGVFDKRYNEYKNIHQV